MTPSANIASDDNPVPDKRGERGLALLTVVLALAVLSVIALAMMSAVLSSARAQVHLWAQAQADALAEAAVIRAALALTDSRAERRWPVDGRPIAFAFEGVAMTLRIEDELGKIDINNAGEGVIRALLRAAGQSDRDADLITRNIVDWRDARGAGVAPQAGEKQRAKPRHGAFQSLDELRLAPGMTGTLYAAIAPALTVYSQSATIEPKTAPLLALRAAQGLDEAAAQALIEQRAQPSDSTTPPGVLPIALPLAGRAVSVDVSIPLAGKLYSRKAVLRLTGDAKQPYWVLDWR